MVGAYDSSRSSTGDIVALDRFQIHYQDESSVTGDYINETVAIGKTEIRNLTMGIATRTSRPVGIMGIGYSADESIAEVNQDAIYPNIVQQMKDQGLIGSTSYSLWLNDLGMLPFSLLCQSSKLSFPESLTGSILFGGVDTAKYTGPLIALPIQKGSKGTYQDITVALSSFSLTDASGKKAYSQSSLALPVILDSGTTNTYLPSRIANDLFGGAGVIDDPQLGPIVPCKLASSPAKFTFSFGGNNGPAIDVGFDQFVTPIVLPDGSVPEFRDGSGDICTFGIMSSGTADEPILLGDTFLRSAYVVYDLEDNLVGLAQTKFNASGSHVLEIGSGQNKGIPGASVTATDVAVTQSYTGIPLQQTGATRAAGGYSGGGARTPTFNLGAGTMAKPTGHKGASVVVEPPRRVLVGFFGVAVMLAGMVVGGVLVLVR